LRRKEGRCIPVFFPQILIDWMDEQKAKGRYVTYASIVIRGLSQLKDEEEGEILVSARRRDY